MPASSGRALEQMQRIGDELVGRGVKPGKMFGVPSLKARSKVLCSTWGDDLVVKLPPEVLSETLALEYIVGAA
jgi:hypothetical protein